jgi:hypothetical protein
MWVWLLTITGLDENEKRFHIIHNLNENLVVFAIGDVVKKWLNNMWHLVKFESCLYIIIANVHKLMAS